MGCAASKKLVPLGCAASKKLVPLGGNPPPSARQLDNILKINQTEIMRVTAQTVIAAFFCVLAFTFLSSPAYAQTATTSDTNSTSTNTSYVNNLNTEPNVPL